MINSELEYVICNLCCSDSTQHLLTRADGLDIVKCRQCGLIYINPRPKVTDLSLFDKAYYSGGSQVSGYENYIQYNLEQLSKKKNIWAKRLREIEKFSGSKGRILDIGCGAGFFLSLTRENNWDSYGVELSDYASNYAEEEFGLSVYKGYLREAGFPSCYFGAATLWSVLECTRNPLIELEEVNRILKPGGILGIWTPNAKKTKLLGTSWFGFKSWFDRLYYFSPENIRAIVEEAGFEIIALKTENRHSIMEKLVMLVKNNKSSVEFTPAIMNEDSNQKNGALKKVARIIDGCLDYTLFKIYTQILYLGDRIILYAQKPN